LLSRFPGRCKRDGNRGTVGGGKVVLGVIKNKAWGFDTVLKFLNRFEKKSAHGYHIAITGTKMLLSPVTDSTHTLGHTGILRGKAFDAAIIKGFLLFPI
jgi:hypothetical protein